MIDRGLALFQHRRKSVEFAFGNGLAADQLATATVIKLCQPEVGQSSFQQGTFNGAVEAQEWLAGLDLLPRLELEIDDGAIGLQAQVHPLQCLERANGRQAGLPWALDGGGHGNADRRSRRREALNHRVDRESFVRGQDQHNQ
ncbi:hypothetical protein D3C79_882830 [compost metagenome]